MCDMRSAGALIYAAAAALFASCYAGTATGAMQIEMAEFYSEIVMRKRQ